MNFARWLNPSSNRLQLLTLIILVHVAGYVIQSASVSYLYGNLYKENQTESELNKKLSKYYGLTEVNLGDPSGHKASKISNLSKLSAKVHIKGHKNQNDTEICAGYENIQDRTLYLAVDVMFDGEVTHKCRTVELVRNTQFSFGSPFQSYFLGGVQVVGDWEMTARFIEYLFSKPGQIKLSKYTRAQALNGIVNNSVNFVESMRPEKMRLLGVQVLSLFLGPIQYWCIALWLFCLTKSIGEHRKLKQAEGNSLTIEKFNSAGVERIEISPIQYNLYSRVLADLEKLKGLSPSEFRIEKRSIDDGIIKDINFEKTEYDDKLITYRGIVDTIGSLAFVGTIAGIIMAMLFLADTKSADVLVSIPAFNQLYNSMGVAFGTTLVGLILSTIASSYFDISSQNYKGFLNSIKSDISEFTHQFSETTIIGPIPVLKTSNLWFEKVVIGIGIICSIFLWLILRTLF